MAAALPACSPAAQRAVAQPLELRAAKPLEPALQPGKGLPGLEARQPRDWFVPAALPVLQPEKPDNIRTEWRWPCWQSRSKGKLWPLEVFTGSPVIRTGARCWRRSDYSRLFSPVAASTGETG